MKKRGFCRLGALASGGFLIATAAYAANLLVVSSSFGVSPTDALFLEGAVSLLVGALLLLGRGGLNYGSIKAAILAATASAVSGAETSGPREIMKRDAWKAIGFLRCALVLLFAGVFMLLGYFLTA